MSLKIDMGELLTFFEDAAKQLGDMEEFVKVEAEMVHAIAVDAFRNEKSPDGTPWAQLKPSTLKYKKGGSKKLIETGRGRQTLTTKATKKGVEIGFGTDYMGYHQTGTGKMPARPMFPVEADGEPMMTGEAKKYYEGMVQRWVAFVFKNHMDKVDK